MKKQHKFAQPIKIVFSDEEKSEQKSKTSMEMNNWEKDLKEHELRKSLAIETQLSEPFEGIIKAEFSTGQREKLAKKDQALPDGSYPIRNVSDLKNAIHAFGRAKDKPRVKAWIKRRAKELGEESLIPEDWQENAKKDEESEKALSKGCGSTKEEKTEKIMHKFKEGTLKSGKSKKKVKNRKQAIAIMMSETGQSKNKALEDTLRKALDAELISQEVFVKARSGIYKPTKRNIKQGRAGERYGNMVHGGQTYDLEGGKKPLPKKGTPEWHKLEIAKKTVKMTPAMVGVMGGPSMEEAKKTLKEYGINYEKSIQGIQYF